MRVGRGMQVFQVSLFRITTHSLYKARCAGFTILSVKDQAYKSLAEMETELPKYHPVES